MDGEFRQDLGRLNPHNAAVAPGRNWIACSRMSKHGFASGLLNCSLDKPHLGKLFRD
jgi:hypothetical protein